MAAIETLPQREPVKDHLRGLQVSIPAPVHKALRVEAEKRDTTMGGLVTEALVSYLGLEIEEPGRPSA